MQTMPMWVQGELGERVVSRPWTPKVRPTADAELEELFVRAAQAWARWRDRECWSGRG